jgi:hypothetical protein
VSRKIGQGGRRLAADWLEFGDCDVLSAIEGPICGTSGGGYGVGGRALVRKNGNGVGAVVMGARGVVGIVLATGIDVLDDGLCIWPVIRLNYRRITVSRRQNTRRIGKRVQVRPLGCSRKTTRQWQSTEQKLRPLTDGSILEDDKQAGVILPLDLEAAIDALPIGKGGLDVLGLELLIEAGERKDSSDGGRQSGQRRGHY